MDSSKLLLLFAIIFMLLYNTTGADNLCDVCNCKPGKISCEADAVIRGIPSPPDIQWPQDDDVIVSFDGIPWSQLFRFSKGRSIKILSLNNNGIDYIQPSAFSGLENLKELHIINNRLTFLTRQSLKGLSRLQRLDLSGNGIVEIAEEDLEDLQSLQELTVKDNQLTSIPNSAIEGLYNLTLLDLGGNKIFNVQFGDSLHRLSSVDLSRNKLTVIFKTTFDSAKSLEYLNLSDNDIASIEDGSFEFCTSLRQLGLSNNKLKELPDLPYNLAVLSIRYNEISQLEQLPSGLQYLDISHNKLYVINEQHFQFLSHLTMLNVSSNEINEMDMENPLPEMKSFDISFNKLEIVPKCLTSSKLPELEYLDISGNLFTSIKFDEEIKLRVFKAGHLNQIQELKKDDLIMVKERSVEPSDGLKDYTELEIEDKNPCVDVIISHCPNLTTVEEETLKHLSLCHLDLSYNNLKGLSENVAKWENIVNGVNLQGNPWNCECELQWLLNSLLGTLYIKHPFYLLELRCETPRPFQGLRLVHWYQREGQVFCNGSFIERSSNYILSESKENGINVTMASNSIIIGMMVAIVVLFMAVIFLIVYLIRGKRRQDRRLKRQSMKRRQTNEDTKNVKKELNDKLTQV